MWHYQGTLSRADARRWGHYWTTLGWSVKLQRTRKGLYYTWLKFPRR